MGNGGDSREMAINGSKRRNGGAGVRAGDEMYIGAWGV